MGKVILKKQNVCYADGGSFDFNNLVDGNFWKGLLGGTADIIKAANGTESANITNYYGTDEKESGKGSYLLLGGFLLLIIIVLFVIIKNN